MTRRSLVAASLSDLAIEGLETGYRPMARQYSSVVAACRIPGDVDPAFSGSQVDSEVLTNLSIGLQLTSVRTTVYYLQSAFYRAACSADAV